MKRKSKLDVKIRSILRIFAAVSDWEGLWSFKAWPLSLQTVNSCKVVSAARAVVCPVAVDSPRCRPTFQPVAYRPGKEHGWTDSWLVGENSCQLVLVGACSKGCPQLKGLLLVFRLVVCEHIWWARLGPSYMPGSSGWCPGWILNAARRR